MRIFQIPGTAEGPPQAPAGSGASANGEAAPAPPLAAAGAAAEVPPPPKPVAPAPAARDLPPKTTPPAYKPPASPPPTAAKGPAPFAGVVPLTTVRGGAILPIPGRPKTDPPAARPAAPSPPAARGPEPPDPPPAPGPAPSPEPEPRTSPAEPPALAPVVGRLEAAKAAAAAPMASPPKPAPPKPAAQERHLELEPPSRFMILPAAVPDAGLPRYEPQEGGPALELKGWKAPIKPPLRPTSAADTDAPPRRSLLRILGGVAAGLMMAVLLGGTGYLIFTGALGRILSERLARDDAGGEPAPGVLRQSGAAGADPVGADGMPASAVPTAMKGVLKGATGRPMRALAFSPNSARLAALDISGGLIAWTLGSPSPGQSGGGAASWDLEGVQPRALLTESGFTWASFASDGRTLVAGDGWSASRWDLGEDEPKARPLGSPPSANPDQRPPLVSADGNRVVTWEVSGPDRMKFRVWEVATGSELVAGEVPRFIVKAATLSPSGQFLAFSKEHGVYLYDVNSRRELEPITGFEVGGGPDSPGLAFSPDGTNLAVIGRPSNVFRRQLCLWAIQPAAAPESAIGASAAKPRSSRLVMPPIPLDRDPLAVAYAPGGGALLLQDTKALTVYEAGSGLVRTTIPLGTLPRFVASPDGSGVAVSQAPVNFQSAQVRTWSLADGQGTNVFPQARRGVGLPSPPLAYTGDGRWLAIGEGNGSVTVWNLAGRGLTVETVEAAAVHQVPEGQTRVTGLGFSPDGRWLLCNCPDANQRFLALDVESGKFTEVPISTFLRTPASILFLPEEGRMLAPGPNKTSHLGAHRWNLRTGASDPAGLPYQFLALAPAPDGGSFAASYMIPGEGPLSSRTVLARWPMDDPEHPPVVLSDLAARRLIFSTDGKTLAGEFLKPKQRAPVIEVWRLPSPRPLATMQPHGVLAGVLDDGNTIATLPGEGVGLGDHVLLWNTATGQSAGSLDLRRGHVHATLGFAFHPNDRMFATVGGTARSC
jgi:WD40 repeat protein